MSNPEGINQYSGGGKSSPDKVAARVDRASLRGSGPSATYSKAMEKRASALQRARAGGKGRGTPAFARATARWERVKAVEAAHKAPTAYKGTTRQQPSSWFK